MDEVNKGRTARMNEQANILFNFDISSSFSGNSAGKIELSLQLSYLQRSLYAALARGLYIQEGFASLGRRLEAIASHAYVARQTEVMQEASSLMLALPLPKELHSVAQYYQAIYTLKQGDADKAQRIIGAIIDTASPTYQGKGLLSTGGIYVAQGKLEAGVPYFLAAAKTAGEQDIQTFATAQRMIAVVRSIYGDHRQAINDLERLFPLFRAIAKQYPTCYYDFLNSYAVELGEVGRISEAQNVCALTLRSPFITAYSEYTQTRDELEAKRTAATPSVIAVSAAMPEIIPAPEAQAEPEPEPARARSTIYLKLRRSCSAAHLPVATPESAVIFSVNPPVILDRLPESTLPRGPPALGKAVSPNFLQSLWSSADHQTDAQNSCVLSAAYPPPLQIALLLFSLSVPFAWRTFPPYSSSSRLIGVSPKRRINLEIVRAGCRSRDSPPCLTARLCANRPTVNTSACRKVCYLYDRSTIGQRKNSLTWEKGSAAEQTAFAQTSTEPVPLSQPLRAEVWQSRRRR
jgi:hypothetical protein